jgi:hypothetical protein
MNTIDDNNQQPQLKKQKINHHGYSFASPRDGTASNNNIALPNLISPSIISLFETLANECVRHIAFRIDKKFYNDAKQNSNGWRTIGENKEYIRSAPGRVLGVDVETIETVKNKRQLARLSVVELIFGTEEDALPAYKTVLDIYVEPGEKVVDYRTNVSGISEDLLNDKRKSNEIKTFTEAQSLFIELGNNLAGANVYLVGHALINDLKATKVIPCVKNCCLIDTAYLYSYAEVPFKNVGLKLVMQHILNLKVQEGDQGHSSVEDAISALKLVVNEIHLLKKCERRKKSIPLELAPWYSTLQVFSILESHREEAFKYLKNIVTNELNTFYSNNNGVEDAEDANSNVQNKIKEFFQSHWLVSSRVDTSILDNNNSKSNCSNNTPNSNRYAIKIQLPNSEVALNIWKQLGKGDEKTHIMVDAEGFWLKKVNIKSEHDSSKISGFITRMYINRANISSAEQGERKKGNRGRAEYNKSLQWSNVKRKMKQRSHKRGRRCAVCSSYLQDNDYVKPVAFGSSRYLHTSAKRCAEVLNLLDRVKITK